MPTGELSTKAERPAARNMIAPAMSHDAVAELVERYLTDEAFRMAFARDPDEAVTAAGFELEADEIAALHAKVSARDDQPLKPRVSKYSFGS